MHAPWKKSYDEPKQHIKKQRYHFTDQSSYSQSYGFSSSHVWIWELDHEESWALLNCGAGEDSWESLGLQGDPTGQYKRKSTLNIHWEDWGWSWSFNTLATSCEERTHWKRPWCWERLKVKGEGGAEDEIVREHLALLTQWTWIWANSGRQWRTGEPAVHEVTESQTNLGTEQQQQILADH